MTKLYSYVLRFDDGAAPNPFWGVCTLTICKPDIRRTAEIGDWVIGTGSKNSSINDGKTYDLSDSLVYAMKIQDIKSLKKYDKHCQESLQDKIPKWFDKDWRKRMGDCIYDYSNGVEPTIRKGVHNETARTRDMRGQNALLSTHFYYFGEEPRPIPEDLKGIIKRNQKHLKIENPALIEKFEAWISQFEKGRIYADPQLKHEFDTTPSDDQISKCSARENEDDTNSSEGTNC